MHRVKSRAQIAFGFIDSLGVITKNGLGALSFLQTKLFRFLLIDHDQGHWRRNGGLCFIANLIIWNRFGFSAEPGERGQKHYCWNQEAHWQFVLKIISSSLREE